MCGIAGFCVHPDDTKFSPELALYVLGNEIESRGKDATGVFTVNRKGKRRLKKAPIRAGKFLDRHFGIGENAEVALLHTRAATKGDPTVAVNNHPIVHGTIVGIHNGVIRNDDRLFETKGWPRTAEVDSEAIFATIHAEGHAGLTGLDGSWAIGWVDTADSKRLWVARGDSSPLVYTITENGTFIFASTYKAVDSVMDAMYGRKHHQGIINAPEGFLATITPGEELNVLPKMELPVRATYSYAGYGADWEAAAAARTASLPTSVGGRGQHHPSTARPAQSTTPSTAPASKGVPAIPAKGESIYVWVKDPRHPVPNTKSNVRAVCIDVEEFTDHSYIAYFDLPTMPDARVVHFADPSAGTFLSETVRKGDKGYMTGAEYKAHREAVEAAARAELDDVFDDYVDPVDRLVPNAGMRLLLADLKVGVGMAGTFLGFNAESGLARFKPADEVIEVDLLMLDDWAAINPDTTFVPGPKWSGKTTAATKEVAE